MPSYEFECANCTKKIIEIKQDPENIDNEEIQNCPDYYRFDVEGHMSSPPKEGECPECGTISEKRIFFPAPTHWGLTAEEKMAGTTKQRFDMGKFMKDQRVKRQRQAEPNSKDKLSNELWTNTQSQTNLLKDMGMLKK